MMAYPAYFAAWHRDHDVLLKSTSGGVFTALAMPILKNGGIVVGAAYDDNLNVRHIVVDTENGLNRLRGVKYVHGEMGREIYDGIASALSDQRKVLFTGLPCQAAAIRQRFGKAEGLVIVELICFGAPPLSLWRKYVDWLEKQRGVKLKYIDPRDKSKGWGVKTYYRYEWVDGKVSRRLSIYDPYAQAFYRSIGFGMGCFKCPFKGSGSRADITIGDCNGYREMSFTPKQIKQGISCVIVRSAVGEDAIDIANIQSRDVPAELMINGNRPIILAAEEPPDWKAFNADMQTEAFESLSAKYHLQITPTKRLLCMIKAWLKSLLRPVYNRMFRWRSIVR